LLFQNNGFYNEEKLKPVFVFITLIDKKISYCRETARRTMSLTNSRDVLHHSKQNHLKQSRDHNHAHLWSDMTFFISIQYNLTV